MNRGLLLIILTAGLIAALRPMEQGGTFHKVNQKFRSWLSANSTEGTSSPSVTFLRLEEGDWSNWPPDPIDYATIFSSLHEFSPPAVAVEPILDWEDPHPQQISGLAAKSHELKRLLLGIVVQMNPAVEFHDTALESLFEYLPNVSGDISKLPAFTGIQSMPPPGVRHTHYIGHTFIDLGSGEIPDQDLLRVPLLARFGDKVIPSFVLQAVLLKERLPLSHVRVRIGDAIEAGENFRIPIDSSGHLAVSPNWKTQIPTLSAEILFAGPNPDPSLLREGESIAAVESLRTNLVLIGRVGEGVRTFDRPGGGKITRAEIFAAAIATIQSGRFSVRLPETGQFFVWAGAALFSLLVVLLAKRRPSALTASALGLLAIVIISLLAFKNSQFWCPPTIPASIIVLGAIVAFVTAGKHPTQPAQPGGASEPQGA